MIPAIGLMLSAYIITRMVSFLCREGDRKEAVVVIILAGATILVTLLCMVDLLTRGLPTP